MATKVLAARIVSPEAHQNFAIFSADQNPMHMDVVAARRTQAGLPVVHGVHNLLWMLDTLCACGVIVSPLEGVRAKFLKWVYLGDETLVMLPLAEAETVTDPTQLTLQVLDSIVITLDLVYGTPRPAEPELIDAPSSPLTAARDFPLSEMEGHTGIAYVAPEEVARQAFPHLASHIGATACAEIAACSYVVGMEVPGLNSMFSKLELRFIGTKGETPRNGLRFEVLSVDERFRKTRIAVSGGAIAGRLEGFVRMPPVEQASIASLAGYVRPGEFAGMDALILGGSRGLGELTAKLIAAGGGTPTITYALGRVEADKVAQEIRDWGRNAATLHYDVRHPASTQLDSKCHFTHIFYFATNAIFRPKGELISSPILAEFMIFYIFGFYDLCQELLRNDAGDKRGTRTLTAYYPSSVAVEDRPAGMTEYSMVKAAGEQMCRDMDRYIPGLRIVTTRLPRLRTDQTSSVMPERELDPVTVLLPILREMHGLEPRLRSALPE